MEEEKKIDSTVTTAREQPSRLWETSLRILALGLTTVASIIMAVNKETQMVDVKLSSSLPALPVLVHAKSFYSSAFLYFFVVNMIACGYGLLHVFFSILARRGRFVVKSWVPVVVVVADVIVVGLLFSGSGAASAVGFVGERGNSHLRWNKVCDMFGRFCSMVRVSVATSLVGCLVYLVVIVLSIVNLHRRSVKPYSGSV